MPSRREELLELVRRNGFAALNELATKMDVSESTVRRDLALLEQEGTVRRTHGGAFYTGPMPAIVDFENRQVGDWDKKQAIARAAAEFIEDGDTLLLDGGSTTYEFARMLLGRPLQVVTNSLPVASLFMAEPTIDVIVIGGYVHQRTGAIHGSYANEMLSTLDVRRAVLSAAGVNRRGLFNSNLHLVETERAMMQAADEVILIADSTKFGHRSLAHVCPLEKIHRVVVDQGLTPEWREYLVAAGVELVLADVPPATHQQAV